MVKISYKLGEDGNDGIPPLVSSCIHLVNDLGNKPLWRWGLQTACTQTLSNWQEDRGSFEDNNFSDPYVPYNIFS